MLTTHSKELKQEPATIQPIVCIAFHLANESSYFFWCHLYSGGFDTLLNEFENIKLLKSVVCERISFRRAALAGLSVVEYKPEDSKAIYEMDNLYKEIFG